MSTISRITFTCVLLSIFASSCAIDPYQEGSIQKELAPGRWQISYGGSKGATVETLQTNWLYRAATLTISEGYAGFEIVTRVRFDSARGLPSATNDDVSYFGQRAGAVGAVTAYLADAVIHGGIQPSFECEIRLLKKPLAGQPPKVFDAAVLKAALEPHVNGMKCENDNVCPHDHDYLRP